MTPPATLSPLLSVDRQPLSLILQHLPRREKVLEVTHLCGALPPLEPLDFSCDELVLRQRPFDFRLNVMERREECNTASAFCSSPLRAHGQRLFSRVQRLSLSAWSRSR